MVAKKINIILLSSYKNGHILGKLKDLFLNASHVLYIKQKQKTHSLKSY